MSLNAISTSKTTPRGTKGIVLMTVTQWREDEKM